MDIQVDGRHIFAATGGRPFDAGQPAVIFIHGAGMDHTVWQLQTRYFANHGWSVLAVDLHCEPVERLEPALAFYMIVAWRVLFLTMLGRECPEMPCDVVFEQAEWQAVYIVTERKPPPDTAPTLDQMVRRVAGLGGFLNRKSDGFPGPQTLWIGLQRAADFVLAMDAQRGLGEGRYG